MTFKKVSAMAVIVFALAGTGINTVSALAAAPNTTDTAWANKYNLTSPHDHTPARTKNTKSYYYNNTKKISGSGNYIKIWAALYDGTDVSANHSYKSYQGQTTKLYNLAYEHRNKPISVRIESESFKNGLTASGVWSPDYR